ncbi:GNAT family N-acetyltransferase [Aquimarina pacifica]|uniref:GNAT family N-acetyltransferase n=1 Tax=Aquimarina pacifica TaxID=1296415 RepID=UPI0004B55A53|nr:GNAT family N-acetyltransferase [Aquimarina pacifica]
MSTSSYIFTSERLGFRNWETSNLKALHAINNDDEVMEFFPFKPSKKDTEGFIQRMQQLYTEKKYCYFAVDILQTNECIGFIGLCEQTYINDLGTFVDIGWRLKKSSWHNGYATEGAKKCLAYGFKTIGLSNIYSVAPEINTKSESVMKKIGMQYVNTFLHPKLIDNDRLKKCVLYKISNPKPIR